MSPLRAYRCENGHEFTVYEHMQDPAMKQCPERKGDNGVPTICLAPVTRVISPTNAHVKGGTPRFHKGKA